MDFRYQFVKIICICLIIVNILVVIYRRGDQVDFLVHNHGWVPAEVYVWILLEARVSMFIILIWAPSLLIWVHSPNFKVFQIKQNVEKLKEKEKFHFDRISMFASLSLFCRVGAGVEGRGCIPVYGFSISHVRRKLWGQEVGKKTSKMDHFDSKIIKIYVNYLFFIKKLWIGVGCFIIYELTSKLVYLME